MSLLTAENQQDSGSIHSDQEVDTHRSKAFMHAPVFPRATSSASFSGLFFVASLSFCHVALQLVSGRFPFKLCFSPCAIDQLATFVYLPPTVSLLALSSTRIFLSVSLPLPNQLQFPALPFVPKS